MASEIRQLLDRADREGWNKGLAYHVARLMHDSDKPEKMRVCVLVWLGMGWSESMRQS